MKSPIGLTFASRQGIRTWRQRCCGFLCLCWWESRQECGFGPPKRFTRGSDVPTDSCTLGETIASNGPPTAGSNQAKATRRLCDKEKEAPTQHYRSFTFSRNVLKMILHWTDLVQQFFRVNMHYVNLSLKCLRFCG